MLQVSSEWGKKISELLGSFVDIHNIDGQWLIVCSYFCSKQHPNTFPSRVSEFWLFIMDSILVNSQLILVLVYFNSFFLLRDVSKNSVTYSSNKLSNQP